MLNKMPKPLFKTLLGLFILGFTVVACNNKKKEDEKAAPKQESVQPTPTPTPDSPMMKKDSMGVVPDH